MPKFITSLLLRLFGPPHPEKTEEAAHAHPVAAPVIPDLSAARCILSGDDRDAADAALIAAGIKRPKSLNQ